MSQDGLIEDPQNKLFTNQIRLNAYMGLFKIIKIMRETYFMAHFPQIMEHIWALVTRSKERIE